MAQVKREQFENNSNYEVYETDVPNITVFYNLKIFRMAVFTGSRKRTSVYFQYTSHYLLFRSIDSYINDQFKENKQKEQRKLDGNKAREAVMPGDVFKTHWGYDQTNSDFFEVIGRKSRTRVIIRQIGIEVVKSDNRSFTTHVKPIPGNFIGPEKSCMINLSGNLVKADRYDHNAYHVTDLTKSHYTSNGY